jgi:hypothetical protein
MHRSALAGLLLLAAACSSGGGGAAPTTTPSPVPAPGASPMVTPEAARGPAIRYPKSGGGIARYAFSRLDTVVATMPSGETQLLVLGRTAFLTLTWIAADSGTRVTAAIDSVVADSGTVPAAIAGLDSARGSRWTALRTPTGKLINLSGGSPSLAGDQIRDQLFLLFPMLPKDGVSAGQTWTDSTDVPTRLSAFEATEQVVRQSVAGSASGSSPLPIDVVRQRSASSKVNQYGQEMLVTAQGVDSLQYHLGGDGRIMSVAGRRHTSITIQLPAVGQTVPAQETSALRMTLIR